MSSYEQSQPAQAPSRDHLHESTAANAYAPRSRPNAALGGVSWAISAQELISLCHRVGQSLHAGVEIRRVWKQEANRGSATHRRHMEHIFQEVSGGGTVADAMRDCG